MTKVFGYELRRLLINKVFLALMVIVGVYSYYILNNEIILGIANTAPFSQWSIQGYIAGIAPFMLIALLFFVTNLYSRNEVQVQTITLSTPVDRGQYMLVKCLAMIVGFLIIGLIPFVIACVFMGSVFQFYAFWDFILPFMIVLLPSMVFVLGLGLVLGRIRPMLVYILMALCLLLIFVPLPQEADLLGGTFAREFPRTLGRFAIIGEPEYILPPSIWISKAAFLAVGLLLAAIGLWGFEKHRITAR